MSARSQYVPGWVSVTSTHWNASVRSYTSRHPAAMPSNTLDAVGWFCAQNSFPPSVYSAGRGPCVSIRWLSIRQKPTFSAGATSAVFWKFHSE